MSGNILFILTNFKAVQKRAAHIIETNYGTFRGWIRSVLAQLEFVLGRLEDFIHPDLNQVQRLVFVCLGNINRSAFAAEACRIQGVQACSIGLVTTTGALASIKALAHAPRFGVNLVTHTATNISDYVYQSGDLLLVMEIRHARQLHTYGIPVRAIALLGHWSSPHRIHLHDPHTLSDAYFRSCFTLIFSAVNNLVADLTAMNSPSIHR